MNVQEFAELAAGYALGALSDADRETFEAARVAHPEWEGILDTDTATVAALAETVVSAAPPLSMRGALLSKIMTLPQDDAPAPVGAAPALAEPVEPAPTGPDPIVWPGPELAAPAPVGLSDATVPIESTPVPEETVAFDTLSDEPVSDGAVSDETVEDPAATSDVPRATQGPATQLNELDPSLFATRTPEPSVEPELTTGSIQAVSRRNWTRGLLTLAASLVVLVVLGFGAVNLNQWVNRPAAVVALQEIESSADGQSATVEVTGGSGVATAHWSGTLGKAVLVTDGLPTIASGETFELWFVREDGTPVSAGTFDAAGAVTTTLLDGPIEAGDTIAVTVEAAGGSTTGTPTTEPIVAIPTA